MENFHDILSEKEVVETIQNATNSKNVLIINWTLNEKDGELTGFLGGYLKLHVVATIEGLTKTFNFFVKTLPSGSSQKEFVKSINLFNKEATVYSDVFRRMPSAFKFAARSYFSRDDLLLFDDLALQGYTLMPPRIEFSQKHVQIVLRTLANMHASSIIFERNHLKGQLLEQVYDKSLFEVLIYRDNLWLTNGLKTIEMIVLKRSKHSKNPEMCKQIKDKFMTGLNQIYDFFREVPAKYKKVLCHRDLWRNNIMFKFETIEGNLNFSKPLECLLVDFQLARCVPPADDIMMALYELQRSKERERDYLENLKYYYDNLDAFLTEMNIKVEEILPFDELVESCEHFRLLGALIKAIYLQTTCLPPGEMDKLRADDQKYQDFVNYDRSVLLKYIDTDEYFREWMLEAVEELLEMIVFKNVNNRN